MRLCCWLSALTVAVAMYCPDRCRGAERERGREREREITGKYRYSLLRSAISINVLSHSRRGSPGFSLSLSPSVASGQYRFRGRAIEELAVQGKVQHCRQLVVVVEEEETS